MSEELGRIQRPEAAAFKGKRKLYLVPLLLSWPEAPAEYIEKYDLYWQQAADHLAHLEERIGRISHIFHESVYQTGDEALKVLEKLSPAVLAIAKPRCQAGAIFEAAEDRDLFDESLDWERFLMMGFASEKVAGVVSENYTRAIKERYQHIAETIAKSIKEDEAGVLFMREGSSIQFPPELEVFSVAPLALDDIHRWLRDRHEAPSAPDEETPEEKPS